MLYVTGNYSGVLTRLDRRFSELEIRRGFVVFQLMTILEEARHSLILVEHDPMRFEDAREMNEYVSGALHQAAQEATVLLFASGVDPYFEELVQNADRILYFDEGPRAEARMVAKTHPRTQEPDHPGGLYMRWLLRREGRAATAEPLRPIDPRRAELQAAKEILAEIFRVRAGEVEEMIRSRMAEERVLPEGGMMWPERFWVGE